MTLKMRTNNINAAVSLLEKLTLMLALHFLDHVLILDLCLWTLNTRLFLSIKWLTADDWRMKFTLDKRGGLTSDGTRPWVQKWRYCFHCLWKWTSAGHQVGNMVGDEVPGGERLWGSGSAVGVPGHLGDLTSLNSGLRVFFITAVLCLDFFSMSGFRYLRAEKKRTRC